MKNLLTGYAITLIVLSACDSVTSIIHSLGNWISSSIDLKTTEKQLQITKLADQEKEGEYIKAIGFAANDTKGDEKEYEGKSRHQIL